MDQEFDLEAQNELLAEQLTGDELHQVLERLGQDEFLSSDAPTVKDVVEGTGANPVAVGRALAEVRKQSFDERFAAAFGDHEKRIGELESKPPVVIHNLGQADLVSAVDAVIEKKRRDEAQQRAQAFAESLRLSRNRNRIVGWVVAFGCIMLFVGTCVSQTLYGPEAISVSGNNGVTITKTRDGQYKVTRPDSSQRRATDTEKDLVDQEEAKIRHWNKPVRGAPLPPSSP